MALERFVDCPGCKTKLKMPVERILPKAGARFRCPRCRKVFLVKPRGAPSVAGQPAAGTAVPPAVERARRLARNIIADIALYSPEQAAAAIRAGNFREVFAARLAEGQKLFESRIPPEVRAEGNFLDDAIEDFIKKKKSEF